MKRLLVLTFLALTASAAGAQETMYITDILQLGLFRTQEGSGVPLRNLVSGTELTVLERIPNFARVRTPDGEEGWVKSLYLITEKPAQLRVAEVEARAEQLARELKQATAERDSAAADAGDLLEEANGKLALAEASSSTLARLQQENEAYEERIEAYRGAVPWPWVAGALIVALSAGFIGGYWWLDAAIRRRHGGFRVY